MYRPGMGVDPWYENFKFFLTYWLLSSNNRDRMGDVDQLPPLPPNGTQGPPPFMSPPPHKNGHEQNNQQNQQQQQQGQNSSAKSPNPIPPPTSAPNPAQISSWENLEKSQHNASAAARLGQNGSHPGSLSDGFVSSLSGFKQQMGTHNSHNPIGGHGNHLGHPINNHGNSVLPEHIIVDKDRRHVCPHCYKGFRSRQQLNQHNLVHSGLRKYHCLYCERAFKQLSHLQQHHRIHTGKFMANKLHCIIL